LKGGKLFSRVMIAAVIAAAAYVILISDYSIVNVGSLYFEKEDLKQDLQRMEEEQQKLIREQKEIREDSFELERLAREKLGMVKPGEKLFKAVVVGETAGEEASHSDETGEAGQTVPEHEGESGRK